MKVKPVVTYVIEMDDNEAEHMAVFIKNVLQSSFGSHRAHDTDAVAGEFLRCLEAANPAPPF